MSIGPQLVKDIFASVEDGLQGIFPTETDLNGGKVVSTIRNKNEVDRF